ARSRPTPIWRTRTAAPSPRNPRHRRGTRGSAPFHASRAPPAPPKRAAKTTPTPPPPGPRSPQTLAPAIHRRPSRRAAGAARRRVELARDGGVEPVPPGARGTMVDRERPPAKVDGAEHDDRPLESRVRRENEQILGRQVADREAADGAPATVDHDVAAELLE